MQVIFGLQLMLMIFVPILSNKFTVFSYSMFFILLGNLLYQTWSHMEDELKTISSLMSNFVIATIFFSIVHRSLHKLTRAMNKVKTSAENENANLRDLLQKLPNGFMLIKHSQKSNYSEESQKPGLEGVESVSQSMQIKVKLINSEM